MWICTFTRFLWGDARGAENSDADIAAAAVGVVDGDLEARHRRLHVAGVWWFLGLPPYTLHEFVESARRMHVEKRERERERQRERERDAK